MGTNMKNIDLASAEASSADGLRRLLEDYVKDLRTFEGGVSRNVRTIGGQPPQQPFSVSVPRLRSRRLEMGAQSGVMTPEQRSVFVREARRAARGARPVDTRIYEIK